VRDEKSEGMYVIVKRRRRGYKPITGTEKLVSGGQRPKNPPKGKSPTRRANRVSLIATVEAGRRAWTRLVGVNDKRNGDPLEGKTHAMDLHISVMHLWRKANRKRTER
jgi:hypothetical protein